MKHINLAWSVLVVILALTVAALALRQSAPQGHASGTTYGDLSYTELSTTNVYPGASADTTVVATSTGRTYLEVANLSTTSPQTLWCATNDKAAVVNAGIPIAASSSRVFENYKGALHCKTATATTGVSVISR